MHLRIVGTLSCAALALVAASTVSAHVEQARSFEVASVRSDSSANSTLPERYEYQSGPGQRLATGPNWDVQSPFNFPPEHHGTWLINVGLNH